MGRRIYLCDQEEKNIDDFKKFVKDLINNTDDDKIVTFEKLDGSLRVMNVLPARLKYVPKDTEDSTKQRKKQNDDVIVVWDNDKEAFRSIRYESIQKIEV